MFELRNNDIIAIIRGVRADAIKSIAEVLVDEGISWVEVSMSDEETGLKCVEALSGSFNEDELRLGAGTVINSKQVDNVISAGARYIITPGWDKELIRYIHQKNMMVIPGVFSPGDVMQAKAEGISLCKLFPVSDLKCSYIKSLKGPFPGMEFIAVGGVNKENISSYLDYGFKAVAIGSDLVPRNAGVKDLDVIRENARAYMNIINKRNGAIEGN